ncbi:MAG: hypothetical protein IJ908_08675 [Fibrobacter sp.]|nr:hypothetical protein [Fibrobacter sp.]
MTKSSCRVCAVFVPLNVTGCFALRAQHDGMLWAEHDGMLWAQHDGKEHSSFMTEERAIVIGLGMTEIFVLNMANA